MTEWSCLLPRLRLARDDLEAGGKFCQSSAHDPTPHQTGPVAHPALHHRIPLQKRHYYWFSFAIKILSKGLRLATYSW